MLAMFEDVRKGRIADMDDDVHYSQSYLAGATSDIH